MGRHPHPWWTWAQSRWRGSHACYGGGRHLAVARALRPADLRSADWRSGNLRSSRGPRYCYVPGTAQIDLICVPQNMSADGPPRAHSGGYASSHDLPSQLRYAIRRPPRAQASGLGVQRLECNRQTAVGRPKAGGRPCAVREDLPGSCRRNRKACDPKSPDFHRVVWGPISRPPGSPASFPPVSRLPAGFFPLRPPSSGFPSSGILRLIPFGRYPVPVLLRFPSGFPFP